MGGKTGGSDADLAEELEKTRRELASRERELAELEAEMGALLGRLESGGSAGLVRRGDGGVVAADAAYRSRLRLELKRKTKKADVLREDVDRARERLKRLGEAK